MSSVAVKMSNVVTQFGQTIVHDGANLTVYKGEIYGILGGSGSGKSTLLKEMIMLLRPQAGKVSILGQDVLNISHDDAANIRRRWGVLFQGGALYSSLTVKENIAVQLKEYSELSPELIDAIVLMKIKMVGLAEDTANLYPAELSGGMIKRVALARALAMDPELLFLDEPTSGLDPVSATAFGHLILELRDILGLTIVMVSHDLDLIWGAVDRLCLLGEKKVIAEGSINEIRENSHPLVKLFLGGARETIRGQYGK